MSFFEAGARVGDGVRWAADKHMAWRLQDGQPVEAISLDEAKRHIERIQASDAQLNGLYRSPLMTLDCPSHQVTDALQPNGLYRSPLMTLDCPSHQVTDALQLNGLYLDVSSTFFQSNPALNPITDAITFAFTIRTEITTEISA